MFSPVHIAHCAICRPGWGAVRAPPTPALLSLGLAQAALAWLMGGYSFDRYKKKSVRKARLVVPSGVDGEEISRFQVGKAELLQTIRAAGSGILATGSRLLSDVSRRVSCVRCSG